MKKIFIFICLLVVFDIGSIVPVYAQTAKSEQANNLTRSKTGSIGRNPITAITKTSDIRNRERNICFNDYGINKNQ